jgi:dephospho-CoA kinase
VIVLGLTGSIGMGKSTTLRLFAEEGCATWDADAAVHRLYQPGKPGAEAVAALFGDGVLTGEGGVDREALGRIVLDDREALTRLEAAIHPLVAEDRAAFLKRAEGKGAEVAVLDVPLLLEGGGDSSVDAVVVVTADEAVRRARVLARPGMTEAKLGAILARQMGGGERTARADHVIRTDEGVDAAREGVRRLLASLREK